MAPVPFTEDIETSKTSLAVTRTTSQEQRPSSGMCVREDAQVLSGGWEERWISNGNL